MKHRPVAVLVYSGLVLTGLLFSPNFAFAQGHGSSPHWSYSGANGPDHWGDLDPSFVACKSGKLQSPIDIEDSRKAQVMPLQFDYKPSPLKIINNGHTFQINYAPGSIVTIGETPYQIVQFHFHTPSEEAISGEHYDMVMHIVHKSANNKLVVVAVLLKRGKDNVFIQKLWANLPSEEGTETTVPNVTIDLTDALLTNHSYYHFTGSLTTPPCTEGVEFYILKTPVEVSSAQIAMFARTFPMNARPIQPSNGREIQSVDF